MECLAGSPQQTQVSATCSCSRGIHREVTPAFSFVCRRDSGEKVFVPLADLEDTVKALLDSVMQSLKN